MLMSGAQVTALASFSDGADVVLLSAIFDPEIHPEEIWFLRSDGVQVLIERDGTIKPYQAKSPAEEVKLLDEAAGVHICDFCGEPYHEGECYGIVVDNPATEIGMKPVQ